jgi:hypothetical protein
VLANTALSAFEDNPDSKKRFSREAETLIPEALVSKAWLLKQLQWPGVAVAEKATPISGAP